MDTATRMNVWMEGVSEPLVCWTVERVSDPPNTGARNR